MCYYYLSEQTDSAGNTYYSFPWGPNTGDVQHITINRNGIKTADWGGPPKIIDGTYPYVIDGKFGQRELVYEFPGQMLTIAVPVAQVTPTWYA